MVGPSLWVRQLQSRYGQVGSSALLLGCLPGLDLTHLGSKGYEMHFECPRWVINRHHGPFDSCPLCPQKQTFVSASGTSAMCQQRTSDGVSLIFGKSTPERPQRFADPVWSEHAGLGTAHCYADCISSTGIAVAPTNQREVHAVVVDMPQRASLEYASPETWGTLPTFDPPDEPSPTKPVLQIALN